MAFKISQSKTFTWPVKVMVPVDGGRHEAHTFDVEFERKSKTEVESLVKRIASGEVGEFEGFSELVKGWKGVVDADGEVPFSDTALQAVLDIPTAGLAILTAYQEALSGEAARRKN